jgi:hypothetical protein
MKRRLLDRIHDRAWREIGERLKCHEGVPTVGTVDGPSSSISASMPWASICSAFADGRRESHNFRRNVAVRDVVETAGPVEGRFYARRIHEWGNEWLGDPAVTKIDTWGDPIRWPGPLLGTPGAFSPTTLRYLATALWLKNSGYLTHGLDVIEIGVGFGGLAAMNALVSGTITTLVDLPQVEHAAMRMLAENDLSRHARLSDGHGADPAHLVVSNYAFTELSRDVQNDYFEKHIRRASHCVIISNAAVFSGSIGGRTDDDLMAWFRSEGIPARLETTNRLLGPGDHLSGVRMIHW